MNLEQVIGQARSVAAAGRAGVPGELGISSMGVRTCFARHLWGLSLPLLGVMLSRTGPAWGSLPDPPWVDIGGAHHPRAGQAGLWLEADGPSAPHAVKHILNVFRAHPEGFRGSEPEEDAEQG